MPKPENTTKTAEGFYEIDENLYFVKDNGDMFELDFDISQRIKNGNKKHDIKNKKRKCERNGT